MLIALIAVVFHGKPRVTMMAASEIREEARPPSASGLAHPVPEVSLLHFTVALAHLANDKDHKSENELRDFLARMAPALGVRVVLFDGTLTADPAEGDVSKARAFLAQAKADAALGGAVVDDKGKQLVQLTIIDVGPRTVLGGYHPSYFKLARLEFPEEANLAALVIGLESTEKLVEGVCNEHAAEIAPLIGYAEFLADRASDDTERDSRARLNFIVAMGLTRWGHAHGSHWAIEKANAYYLQALADWAEENDFLDSAMALLGIGAGLAWRGDPGELDKAVSVFATAGEMYRTQHDPMDQSVALDMEGITLERMAADGDIAHMQAARAKYESALALARRDDDPQHWASLQNHLGTTLERLGSATSNPELLNQAIAAFRTSATISTPDLDKFDWAANQTDLGNALQALGLHAADTTQLEQSVTAFRDALKGYGACYPGSAAKTEENLGVSLANIGLRKNQADYVRQSIDAFQQALNYHSRRNDLAAQATVLDNIAEASATLAEMEGSNARLRDAIQMQRRALRLLPRDREPWQWALIESRMGESLSVVGHRDSNRGDLEQAIRADRDALTVITRSRDPSAWVRIESHLGDALTGLAQLERGADAISDAQAALDECGKALNAVSREDDPHGWALLRVGMGGAFVAWGEQEAGTSHLQQAVEAYHDGLSVLTPEHDLNYWEEAENDLGIALLDIGLRESGTASLEQSVAEFRKALTLISPERFPDQWNMTQHNLGNALSEIKRRGGSA